MKKFLKSATALALMASIAACTPPGVYTEQGNSADNRLTSYQVTAVPRDGKIQNALLVQDNLRGTWELKMASDTLPLGRQLVESLLNPAVFASVISGAAGIRIAEDSSCGQGVCGTVIYSTAVSGSQSAAGASAEAEATANGSDAQPIFY